MTVYRGFQKRSRRKLKVARALSCDNGSLVGLGFRENHSDLLHKGMGCSPWKMFKSGCLEVYSGSVFFLHTQQILLKVIVHVLARVSGQKL